MYRSPSAHSSQRGAKPRAISSPQANRALAQHDDGDSPVATPIALNLREAAQCLSIEYETARRLGLYEQWEEAGVIWRIPGTNTRRVLYEALRRWVYQNQDEDKPGLLASLFKDPLSGR